MSKGKWSVETSKYHKKVCECNKFGCVPCMQRFLRAHYRKENEKGKRGKRWAAVGKDEFTDSLKVTTLAKGRYKIYVNS